MEIELIIIIVSILLSAFFSGMEIAFVSANKMHIELEKKREGFIARILSNPYGSLTACCTFGSS